MPFAPNTSAILTACAANFPEAKGVSVQQEMDGYSITVEWTQVYNDGSHDYLCGEYFFSFEENKILHVKGDVYPK
jgi:hypothetical protein